MSPHGAMVVLRPALEDDWAILDRLAQLDSATCLVGDVIVAEYEGEAIAAVDMATGTVTADPFRPSAHITAMLEMRRRQLLGKRGPRRRWRFGVRRGRVRPRQTRAAG